MVQLEEVPTDGGVAAAAAAAAATGVSAEDFAEAYRRLPEAVRQAMPLVTSDVLETNGPDALPEGAIPVIEQTIKYATGDTYTGETIGTIRHGVGVHQCENGDVYEGEWRDDLRHGEGCMTFARGLEYKGSWVRDKAEGDGVCTYENGDVYDGEWKSDQRWGWGVFDMASGDSYEGQWFGNAIEGKGRYTYADGAYFEGEFRDGRRLRGTYASADGRVEYVGAWKDGARHGHGVYHETGRYKYMGEWADDMRHGAGKCVFADGVTYEGSWADDRYAGRGKLTTHEETLECEWVDGVAEGAGTLAATSGETYAGTFKGGVYHGVGTWKGPEGERYEGHFVQGKRHGKGRCVWADGSSYTGDWTNGRRHGYGVCVFADGVKYKGEWEDDEWVQSGAEPSLCTMYGAGLARARAGDTASFVVEARDELGNARLSGGDGFVAYLEERGEEEEGVGRSEDGGAQKGALVAYGGSDRVWCTVDDRDDGTYGVSYMCTRAGRYSLYVMLGAEELVGASPYAVTVVPAKPAPRRCSVSGHGRTQALVGEEASFAVQVVDRFGNAVQVAAEIDVAITSSQKVGEVVDVAIEHEGEGRMRCTYTADEPGFYRIDVSSDGSPVGASPFSLAVRREEVLAVEAAKGSEGGRPAVGAGTAIVASVRAAVPLPQEVESGDARAFAPDDQVTLWERIAETEWMFDGVEDGWDSDVEHETAEEKYMRENPDVPVVTDLRDIHKVGKLQRFQKEKELKARQERLAELRRKLEAEEGPAPTPRLARGAGTSAAAAEQGTEEDIGASICDLDL
eukprot:PRCOL_00002945-RA